MALEITLLAILLLSILAYIAYRSQNMLLQTLAFISFAVLIPLYFGSFVLTTGEPREIRWDRYFNKHIDKMRVISYLINDREKKIYLWLSREEEPPIYYIINDPEGEKSKKLREAAQEAKKGKGSIYYVFEMKGSEENSTEDKIKKFLGIEETIHTDIFETIAPHGPAPIKQDQPGEIINFNDRFGGEDETPY